MVLRVNPYKMGYIKTQLTANLLLTNALNRNFEAVKF